jgi:hypothetical protein
LNAVDHHDDRVHDAIATDTSAPRAWTTGESGEIEAIVNDVRAFAEAANAHPRIADTDAPLACS